jgi:hypothetical protein
LIFIGAEFLERIDRNTWLASFWYRIDEGLLNFRRDTPRPRITRFINRLVAAESKVWFS